MIQQAAVKDLLERGILKNEDLIIYIGGRFGEDSSASFIEISDTEKKARLQVLLDLQEQLTLKKNRSMVGSIQTVLVEGLRESFTLLGLTALVFYNDWRLAVVAFLVLPVAKTKLEIGLLCK